ncbi:AMP-binding protein [Nonomuraea mangrovi]|uniref:AMP-binding protein n=1 Tax=Nonomuraea mangrovi TaxID=2316207 RepID=A0ABW4T2E3_9ACTN
MTADTLACLLERRAADDRPGLLFEDATWTWREVVAACRERAAALAGVGHVGVLCDNVPELVFLIGAAALGGPVVVALNTTRSREELARDARATDVDLLLWDPPYGPAAASVGLPTLPLATLPLATPTLATLPSAGLPHATPPESRDERGRASGDRAPGELVMLIFTSGTSGTPRAVRITQRKIAIPGLSLGAMLTPDDVVYCSMPLFHSGALMAALAPAVASGAALAVRRRFSASNLLPDIRRHGCTYLHYVGKALSYVLATPPRQDDADNPLRIAFGNEGSASATRRFGERFGCHVIDAFGSTESAVSITPDPSGPAGALGRLPDGIEIRNPATGERCVPAVMADGRLANPDEAIGELVNVAGLGLFDGYYNDEAADAERIRQGAYWSGDLAYADAAGYVYFAGRGTDRLRVDGENLAVAPIEAALREFGGVVEAAVYPVPDPAAGDQVMAALVLDGPFDPAAFAAFTARLGAKAVPRYVRLCEELPQTPSHKVVKRVLVKEAWRTADPVWWRPPTRDATGFRILTEEDISVIEDEFARHGRPHPLES